MKPERKKRLCWIMVILLGVGLAVSLAIYALGQNINLYFTPTQLMTSQVAPSHLVRVGGIVKKNSLQRTHHDLMSLFTLTDYRHETVVKYTGILPALFREGQAVVVQGRLGLNGQFVADEVLAKHDEKYMPPGLPSLS